jgi:hypothetical protein
MAQPDLNRSSSAVYSAFSSWFTDSFKERDTVPLEELLERLDADFQGTR